jgi:CrcB protein
MAGTRLGDGLREHVADLPLDVWFAERGARAGVGWPVSWIELVSEDTRLWKSIIAVSFGASLGGLLRWWLSAELNNLFPTIPPGTLVANLVGGYITGIAIASFGAFANVMPEWRLFVITGFCGGLTTFSTYSAEIMTLLQQSRGLWACAAAAIHVAGSVLMTFAGVGTVAWMRS